MFKSSLILTVANISAAASSYVLTLYLMSVFSLDDFGYYNFILVFSSFYSILIVYATDQTTARNFFKYNCNYKILSNVVFFRCLVLLLGALFLSFFYDFLFLLGFIAFCLPSLNIAFGYEVQSRNFKYAIIYLFERLVYSLIVFLLFFFYEPNLVLLFFVLIIVSLISFIYQIYDLNIPVKIQPDSFNIIPNVFRENSSIMFATIALFSYGGFSRLIIEYNTDYSTLALYSAAWQFVMLGTLFQTQVERVFRPRISNHNDTLSKYSNLTKQYFIYAFIPMFLFSFFVFFFGSDIFLLIVGEKYSGTMDIIKIFSFYFLVISADSFVRMLYVKLNLDRKYCNIHVVFSILLLCMLLFVGNVETNIFAYIVCIVHTFAVIASFISILYFNKKVVHET